MLGGHIVGRTQSWEDAECGNRGGDDLSKTRTQPLVVGNNSCVFIETVLLTSRSWNYISKATTSATIFLFHLKIHAF